MNAIDKLWAIEEIKQHKARFSRLREAKNWPELEQMLSRDAVIDWGLKLKPGDDGIVRGAAPFVELLRRVSGAATTVHIFHRPEIEVTSPTTASAIWTLEERVSWPEGDTTPRPAQIAQISHYLLECRDTYERIDDQWRTASMKISMLYKDC